MGETRDTNIKRNALTWFEKYQDQALAAANLQDAHIANEKAKESLNIARKAAVDCVGSNITRRCVAVTEGVITIEYVPDKQATIRFDKCI